MDWETRPFCMYTGEVSLKIDVWTWKINEKFIERNEL